MQKDASSYESAAYFRSFLLRIVINLAAIAVLNAIMNGSLNVMHPFDLTISSDPALNRDGAKFTLAGYVLTETGVIITLAGLMAVTAIAVLAVLGAFRIRPGEPRRRFRLRLLLYTVAHLLLTLALTTFLLICVATLEQTNSIRLNEGVSFIWAWPTYALVALIYVVDLYGFLTENPTTGEA
jgi:hypothetical protein